VTLSLSPVPKGLPELWQKWYPDAPAVGFLLRDAHPELWVRIHSLPGSKRYSEDHAEHAEIIARHTIVAADVLGLGSRCAVVIWSSTEERWAPGCALTTSFADAPLPLIEPLPESLWDEEHGCFTGPVGLFGGALTFVPGALDGFITAAASDETKGLVVALETGAVYAPYDGGADLFYRSSGERDRARVRFSAWLSEHPAGL
jgi:hypothetical protein